MLPIDERVITMAAGLEAPGLRSLDAIHLATALSLGDSLAVLVSYDRRQLHAADAVGGIVTFPAERV